MKKKLKNQKLSKEMINIAKAISALIQKYNGTVSFIGSFVAFDKEDNVTDDRLFVFGTKGVLKEQIYILAEEIAKSKDNFVNI
jgi:NAD/NADP transhydrogenase beta subunit